MGDAQSPSPAAGPASGPASAPTRRALAQAFGIGFAVLLVVLGFFEAWTRVTGESLPLAGDNQLMIYPITFESYRGFTEGRIPEWTTRIWAGYPLLADPVGGPLYLPHLITFALTSPPHFWAYELTTALHAGFLVAGAVFLLRVLGAGAPAATFGGVLFLLAPFSHQWAVHLIPQWAALSYWPWLLVAAERLRSADTSAVGGYAWLGWLSIAGQIMGGYPEFAIYSGLVAAVWIVGLPSARSLWSRLLRTASLGLGGLALGAPQLLTTASVLAQSSRGELPNPWLSEALSLPWTAPLHSLTAIDVTFTTFLGLGTILLSLIAVKQWGPRAWMLGGLALLGFVLSLGPRGLLYDIFHSIPPLHIFRGPVKFWQVTEVSMALLAALGADVVLRRARSVDGWSVAATLALLLIGGSILERGVHTALRFRHFAAVRAGYPGQSTMLADIAESGLVERASAADGGNRTLFAAHPELFLGNMNVAFGVDSLRGGPAQLLGRTHPRALGDASRPGVLDRAGVRFVLSTPGQCDDFDALPGWDVVERRPNLCLLEGSTVASRYAVIEELVAVETPEALAERMRHDATLPVGVVIDPSKAERLSGATGEVAILSEGAGWAELRVSSSQDAFLLVRESWAPGWEAHVDGAPAAIHRAAGVFFGVEVPAGDHAVTVRYRAAGLRSGVVIALAWIIGALALARFLRASTHRR